MSLTVGQRWAHGVPHDDRSIGLAHAIADLDFDNGDSFCFKFGGDGDNGETLMFLLDSYFEKLDNDTQEINRCIS